MAVKITFTRYHLPQKCEIHTEKNFHESKCDETFDTLKKGVEQIVRWNVQCACWKYCITSIEEV